MESRFTMGFLLFLISWKWLSILKWVILKIPCTFWPQCSDVKDLADEEVIAYASRKLKGSELNYSAHEVESLALVWGVTHFSHYLRGRPFVIFSDHASLKYIFSPIKTKPKLNRWAAILLGFDFEVRYRKGTNNPADCLSRLDVKQMAADSERLT
jgi:hypothetical protein